MHPSAWLSLGRLLLSRACFRFTRIGRHLHQDELPSAGDTPDVVIALELTERVDDALHAYPQIGAEIVEPS